MKYFSCWEKYLKDIENKFILDVTANINTICNSRQNKKVEVKQSKIKTFVQLTFNF